MYLDNEESIALASKIAEEEYDTNALRVAIFPTMLSLSAVVDLVTDTEIAVGAQHVAWSPAGAYTGAVSATFVHAAGASYTLVGHSERRHVFGETNADVRQRLEAAIEAGLTPILCVGETQQDLDEGKRKYRLQRQLQKALEGLKLGEQGLFVAYEPVWAISKGGNGVPCTPEDAADVHQWLAVEIASYGFTDVPLLYGGSVNAQNVVSYLELEGVDGVLVGSASCTYEKFSPLLTAAVTM